jgi:predicted enzyme related to lactoylglutathione lyase
VRRTGPRLRFVYRRGAPSLLVADNARLTSRGGAARNEGRRARASFSRLAGRTTVLIFVLASQVTLKKRPDVEGAGRRWIGRLAADLASPGRNMPWTAIAGVSNPRQVRIRHQAPAGRQEGKAMDTDTRPRLVGINHVALEVGNIEAALEFYGRIFSFQLRGRGEGQAFLDMGDQFLALMEGQREAPDDHRHFGLVVDDRSRVRALAEAAGATLLDGPFLDLLDPWGNRIEVVDYKNIQFSKAPNVLRGMRLEHLAKSEKARKELTDKGLG